MYSALIEQWAKDQGFETWASDHATVLRNMAKWMDNSNPHPEAREEDIEVIRKALIELRSYAEQWDCDYQEECAPGCDDPCPRCKAVFIADEALSRLAASKPEGQDERSMMRDAFAAGARYGGWNASALKAAGAKLRVPNFDTWYLENHSSLRLSAAPEPRPAEEEVITATDGTTHVVLPADKDLAQKLHEMWEDYADDVEENALRIAIYREDALRSQLARKDEGRTISWQLINDIIDETLEEEAAPLECALQVILSAHGYTAVNGAALREPDVAKEETPLQRKIVEVYNREPDGRKGES